MSSIKPNNKEEIELMAKELCKDYVVHLNKMIWMPYLKLVMAYM